VSGIATFGTTSALDPFRVLVLGGTGVFGSRLCRLLAGDPAIAITVAARDGAKVEALARELGIAGLALDWRRGLDRELAAGRFDALVHAAGPFQGQDYAVAETCIRHRVHYLDLADDRAYVCGIDRLDAAARTAGILMVAGASTVPAITGAVVAAALSDGMSIARASFAILPGNDAPRGRAVVEAILSGVGKRIPHQPGRWGWAALRRIAVPGLGRRWAAACDLPEPALFERRYGIKDTYAGAGLELSVLHLGLWLLAWPVRIGLLASLVPAARPLAWLADRLRAFGTDRGGLRIDLEGTGKQCARDRRTWSLLAEGGDGPFVPTTPAVALVRKLARGDVAQRGAMACLDLLSLEEIEAEWQQANLRIAAGWREAGQDYRPSLYRRVLGASYRCQSSAGQKLHDGSCLRWAGRCSVDGPVTHAGRLIARLFSLPPAGMDVPIVVSFLVRDGWETWIRRVGGRTMRSLQYIGARKPPGWLVEQFGPFAFDLALSVDDEGRLLLTMSGMHLLGLPMPKAVWPIIAARESEAEGRFQFDVEIGLPAVGRLVRDRGFLTDHRGFLTDR
jgi:uncharacterized protein YbjT (DUF2867 family)